MNLQAHSGRLLATVRRVAFQIVGSGTESCGVVFGIAEYMVATAAKKLTEFPCRVAMIGAEVFDSGMTGATQFRFRQPADRTQPLLQSEHCVIFSQGHSGFPLAAEAAYSAATSPTEFRITLHPPKMAFGNLTVSAFVTVADSPFPTFLVLTERESVVREHFPASRALLERFAGAPEFALFRRIVGSHDVALLPGLRMVRADGCL